MYKYREPYVQDVKEWVAYYSRGINNSGKTSKQTDADNVAPPNAGSLSETGQMTVTRVEPKGPLPPVPSASAPLPLACLSESETFVQQATLDAKRMQMGQRSYKTRGGSKNTGTKSKRSAPTAARGGNGSTQGKRRGPQTNTTSRQSKTKTKPKKELFGTPHDIFKSLGKKKTSKKK